MLKCIAMSFSTVQKCHSLIVSISGYLRADFAIDIQYSLIRFIDMDQKNLLHINVYVSVCIKSGYFPIRILFFALTKEFQILCSDDQIYFNRSIEDFMKSFLFILDSRMQQTHTN